MTVVLLACGLALAASWPIAAMGWACGALVERLTFDPRWRERVWTVAMALPAVTVMAAVAVAAIPDGPAAPVDTPLTGPATGSYLVMATREPSAAAAFLMEHAVLLAGGMVLASIAGLMVRLIRLQGSRRRLARIISRARPLTAPAINGSLQVAAARLGCAAPPVFVTCEVDRPLLAGFRRPAILLPESAARMPENRLRLICTHEAAHAARRDNLRLGIEELLLGAFWFASPLAAVRARLAAVREEACDAMTLAGANPALRRDYAETLVQALRAGAGSEPQTAFIGTRKGHAMRLHAILSPPKAASRRTRLALTGALGALTASAMFGSVALADQARAADDARRQADAGAQTEPQPQPQAPSEAIAAPAASGRLEFKGLRQVQPKGPTTVMLGSPVVLIDGKPAPAGFDPKSIDPATVERLDITEAKSDGTPGSLNFVLKSVPGPQASLPSGSEPAARATASSDAQVKAPMSAQAEASEAGRAKSASTILITADSVNIPIEGPVVYAGRPANILIDGAPAPSGFEVKSLAPESVERLEFTTGESEGAAATLNFILKADAPR